MAPEGVKRGSARPADTSEEVWQVMTERLVALSPTEKAALANRLSIDVERLARAGIALVEPDASEARIRYLLAERRYGTALAQAAFGSGPW